MWIHLFFGAGQRRHNIFHLDKCNLSSRLIHGLQSRQWKYIKALVHGRKLNSHFSSYHRWFRKLQSCYLPDQLLSDMYCTYAGIQVISGSILKRGRRWEDSTWPCFILASFPVDTSCFVPPSVWQENTPNPNSQVHSLVCRWWLPCYYR